MIDTRKCHVTLLGNKSFVNLTFTIIYYYNANVLFKMRIIVMTNNYM